MSEGTLVAIVLPLWFLLIMVAVLFVFRKQLRGLPRKKLAQVEADSYAPFELKYEPTQSRRLRVFLKYHLNSTKTGGTVSRGISGLDGFACAVKVEVDGQTRSQEVIGRGSDLPREVDRVETVAYYTRESWIGSSLTTKGNILLADAGHVPTGAELVVSGNIELNESTTAAELIVFVSR